MSKVIKSFSLDMETVHILEQYCQQEDTSFGGTKMISRSKLVNDAIVWFLRGDVAELVHGNERLQKKFAEVMKEKDSQLGNGIPPLSLEKTNRPWWRRLLLGQ